MPSLCFTDCIAVIVQANWNSLYELEQYVANIQQARKEKHKGELVGVSCHMSQVQGCKIYPSDDECYSDFAKNLLTSLKAVVISHYIVKQM